MSKVGQPNQIADNRQWQSLGKVGNGVDLSLLQTGIDDPVSGLLDAGPVLLDRCGA
ncbi:MAG: hypothetical protein ABJM43_11620 [Paracoccaceae bacterium]